MRRFLLLLSLTLLLALPAAAQNACTLDITMNCTLPHCAATVVNSGTNTCSGDYYVGFWVVGDQQNTAVVAGIQQNLGVPECFTSSDIPGGVGYGFAFCTGPAALAPGGRTAIIEFVPNDDRVSPPDGALFAMRMLGTTPNGDAYTLAELDGMLREAGFTGTTHHSLAPASHTLIVASRA